jgi:predicted RecB family nuclease
MGSASGEYFSFWADTPEQEKENVDCLCKIIAAYSEVPVVTWAGNGADMPELRKAAERHDRADPMRWRWNAPTLLAALEPIEQRHLDLFQSAANAVRFPIPGLGLKPLADYLGIPNLSVITNGFEAQEMFNEYKKCKKAAKRARLKKRLLEYNRDDMDALVGVAEHLSELAFQYVATRAKSRSAGMRRETDHLSWRPRPRNR